MKCKNFAESSGQLMKRDLQIDACLSPTEYKFGQYTHMYKIIASTSTEPTVYRDNKLQVFTTRDNGARYLKTHTIPKARDKITNQLFICLLTPQRGPSEREISWLYTRYETQLLLSSFSSYFFFIIIYLADVLHRYCLGGALHVGMYRPRKALLDCPLLQHSSPGPKWTICMLHHSAQGIQINWCT